MVTCSKSNYAERKMPRITPGYILIPLGLMTCLVSAACLAAEGKLEINQTCAENGGCFAGDDAGFPVEITESGSYTLTSDLDVTGASVPSDATAIDVAAGDVTIDLNGYTIRGPVTCTGTPVDTCNSSGSGRGIDGGTRTLVKNGTVHRMGDHGIFLGREGVAINVELVENGSYGISTKEDARITGVLAKRNSINGISADERSLIRNVQAIGNGYVGINVDASSLVRNSIANTNGWNGIFMRGQSSAIDNVARSNEGAGISCYTQAAARGSVVSNNAGSNLSSDCTLVDNNICDGSPC